MAKEFIVAIELGSSKISGIAGKKNNDGSISVLALVKEDATSCIRKGVVYNIEKTAQCLVNIVKKLKTTLKTDIEQVYVGIGGQSIRSVKNTQSKDLPADTIVTKEMVAHLWDSNRSTSYPDQEILDVVAQEYRVDNRSQTDPVGIQCLRLEACFLNILWRESFYRSINKCFEMAGINIAELYLAPFVLADSVLSESERNNGCVLVDMGAGTTTVSVYYRNMMRHLAVIPLGGNSITKDIESLQIDETDAEKMKLKYASALTANEDINENLFYPIDSDRQVDSRKFIEIVEARLEEIIANVWNQVPKEYADSLAGGIILTGGGANMPNIDKAFRNFTKMKKVRIANFVTLSINSNLPEIKAKDCTMNTLLGLLAKGNMNCAGRELAEDLFDTETKKETPEIVVTENVTPMTGGGKIETPAEKKRREDDEEQKRQAELEAAREKAEKERRENSWWNHRKRSITQFCQSIIKGDED